MRDDKRRAQPLGEIDGLKRLFDGSLTLLRRNSRKLVTIWRSHHHFDGQRTKIMQTAEADLTGIEHFLNPGHEREPDTVPQLDQIKPEFCFDLTQHFIPGGMPSGVPARGKGNHQLRIIVLF
jgi:hypothetical protein